MFSSSANTVSHALQFGLSEKEREREREKERKREREREREIIYIHCFTVFQCISLNSSGKLDRYTVAKTNLFGQNYDLLSSTDPNI